MSRLKIYPDNKPNQPEFETSNFDEIVEELKQAGIRFEQWQTNKEVVAGTSQEEVIAAFRSDIDRLIKEEGYQSVDVISITSEHPDKEAVRKKFLSEHTHGEDEVRFFVAGQGLFSLHIRDKVYEVLCQQGDFISVPALTTHWFDMGPNPYLVAIRLFNNPDGWVAKFTGNDIADNFPRLIN